MIIQIISAFFAVYMFTMLLDIPKQFAHYSGTIGAVGWFVYFTRHGQGYSPMMAAFASTLVIALLSHILARVKKAPVTVFWWREFFRWCRERRFTAVFSI